MRLLFIADLHYALKQFDWVVAQASSFEAVILGGDLLDLSAPLELDVQIVVIEKYLNRIASRVPVIVCSGNHDLDFKSPPSESEARWLQGLRSDRIHVDGDRLELDGTVINICPWWDGPQARAALEAQLARDAQVPKKRWIWIHHAPPDRSPVSWAGRKFGGDEFLVERIVQYQPDIVLSGHIHNAPFYPDGSWIDRLGRTWVFNPGRQIGPNPAFIILDLEQMSAEWSSIEGHSLRPLRGEAPAPLTAPALSAGGA